MLRYSALLCFCVHQLVVIVSREPTVQGRVSTGSPPVRLDRRLGIPKAEEIGVPTVLNDVLGEPPCSHEASHQPERVQLDRIPGINSAAIFRVL